VDDHQVGNEASIMRTRSVVLVSAALFIAAATATTLAQRAGVEPAGQFATVNGHRF
jgi:hypothetical protein